MNADNQFGRTRAESSINVHFKREAVAQAAIFPVILVLAAIMALVGPWLFELIH